MRDKIEISNPDIGTIEIIPTNKVNNDTKLLIEALGYLQLICIINDNQRDPKYIQFVKILNRATQEARALYEENDTKQQSWFNQF